MSTKNFKPGDVVANTNPERYRYAYTWFGVKCIVTKVDGDVLWVVLAEVPKEYVGKVSPEKLKEINMRVALADFDYATDSPKIKISLNNIKKAIRHRTPIVELKKHIGIISDGDTVVETYQMFIDRLKSRDDIIELFKINIPRIGDFYRVKKDGKPLTVILSDNPLRLRTPSGSVFHTFKNKDINDIESELTELGAELKVI